jgi:hypothetical protein
MVDLQTTLRLAGGGARRGAQEGVASACACCMRRHPWSNKLPSRAACATLIRQVPGSQKRGTAAPGLRAGHLTPLGPEPSPRARGGGPHAASLPPSLPAPARPPARLHRRATQAISYHQLFAREVRLRESMKRLVTALWWHSGGPPADCGYSAHDVIIGLEGGARGGA